MPKARSRKAIAAARRDNTRRVAAFMIALASNISSPLVPPAWGIPLAVLALVAWLYTLTPVERFVISNLRTNPISASAYGVLVILLLCWPIHAGWKAWKAQEEVTLRPVVLGGGGTAIIGAHERTDLDDVHVTGYSNGIDLSPSKTATVKHSTVDGKKKDTNKGDGQQ